MGYSKTEAGKQVWFNQTPAELIAATLPLIGEFGSAENPSSSFGLTSSNNVASTSTSTTSTSASTIIPSLDEQNYYGDGYPYAELDQYQFTLSSVPASSDMDMTYPPGDAQSTFVDMDINMENFDWLSLPFDGSLLIPDQLRGEDVTGDGGVGE